jgi:hypothetical protein
VLLIERAGRLYELHLLQPFEVEEKDGKDRRRADAKWKSASEVGGN